MFKKYLTKDGPPQPQLVKKTVEVPKIKVELHFVGKNGEMEKYVEKYEGQAEKETVEDILRSIIYKKSGIKAFGNLYQRAGLIFLENNNRTMNLEYYYLTKAVILDTKMVEKEIEVRE